ncbi:IS66 family transposase, partial [Methanobacterium alcaliphilum]|uniref:IS66 family transposase n=1 Tax=Methanobacterium alcaliphilum TaxID=392018 RepID=UPI00200AB844
TLYDHKLNLPVIEQIVPNKEYTTIKQFLTESTKNITLIAITTDHLREYKTIIDKSGAKHQLCLFHLFKMISDKIYHSSHSNKISKRDKKRLDKYFKEIQEIFNTNNEKVAINRLEQLLTKFNDIPKVLQRIITKKIIPDFQRLTQFMQDPNISKTNNPVENYYRQTFPKSIKKIFKTIHGTINYLRRKMQNWTQK